MLSICASFAAPVMQTWPFRPDVPYFRMLTLIEICSFLAVGAIVVSAATPPYWRTALHGQALLAGGLEAQIHSASLGRTKRVFAKQKPHSDMSYHKLRRVCSALPWCALPCPGVPRCAGAGHPGVSSGDVLQ